MSTTLKLMLIGKKGQGKSSVGNTLAGRLDGRTPFKVSSNTPPTTTEPSCVWSQLNQYKFLIVDTPDLEIFGTAPNSHNKMAIKEVEKILAMCNGRVDAFIYVVKFGTNITHEDVATLDSLKRIFGLLFYCNLIVLFTHGDDFKSEIENKSSITFKQWCSSQEGCIKDLYMYCEKRFQLINNNEIQRVVDSQQRLNILELSQSLRLACTGMVLTVAASFREELVKNPNAVFLEEDIQQKLDLLDGQIGQIVHLSRNQDLEERTNNEIEEFVTSVEPNFTLAHSEFIKKLISIKNSIKSAKKDELEKEFLEMQQYRITKMSWKKIQHFLNISVSSIDFKGTKILKLMMIGKTGHGKSCVGNTLADRKLFKVSSNATATTKFVDCDWAEIDNYKFKIIDSPGLEDTSLNTVENTLTAIQNMEKALAMCNGGVDAFILVIKHGTKFTSEEKSSIDLLKNIFGESFKKNLIVVITGGDGFKDAMIEDGTPYYTFEKWCEKQDSSFKELYEEVKKRVILINNREKDPVEKNRQRLSILNMADKLKPQYTEVAFIMSAYYRREQIRKHGALILREDIQAKLSLMEHNIELLINELNDKENACKAIQECKLFFENEAAGMDSQCQECITKLETMTECITNNYSKERLKLLLDEIRTFRKAETSWVGLESFLRKVGNSFSVVVDMSKAFVAFICRLFK